MDDLKAKVLDYFDRAPDETGFCLNTMSRQHIENPTTAVISVFDKILEHDITLSDGIPAVGSVVIRDNDFWSMQSPEWQSAYPEMCFDKTMFWIKEIIGSQVLNEQTIRLQFRKLIIELG